MKNNKNIRRLVLKGEASAPGIALGQASSYGIASVAFERYWISSSDVVAESERFNKALKKSREQLNYIKSNICKVQGQDQITIIDSHILLLSDELLVKNTLNLIENSHINAEWALDKAIGQIKEVFARISHAYFRERKYDIDYTKNAILRNLTGTSSNMIPKVPVGALVYAHDLSPAETISLVRFRVGGIITEVGGAHSHTSIVARSMEIPAVMGIEGATNLIQPKDFIIIDGFHAEVIINPTASEILKYKKAREEFNKDEEQFRRESKTPAMTTEGKVVTVLANMELENEADTVIDHGATGVGLFRTEFMFIERKNYPSVDEQEKVYRKILRKIKGSEVCIRTIDLGAEKLVPDQEYLEQPNPDLGLRAIRFCMRNKKIFADQLRALFRASEEGNLKICIPMISSLGEFKKVKKFVEEIRAEVKKDGYSVPSYVPLGIMVETPGAALEMDLLAREVDFFSIGTNDLVQYLLAVDRTNDLVSYLYSPLNPSVLRLLKQMADVARENDKEVTLCGEIAGDPLFVMLLLGLGYRRLSMNPASIPRLKKMLRESSLEKAKKLSAKILETPTSADAHRLLKSRMEEMFPSYFRD